MTRFDCSLGFIKLFTLEKSVGRSLQLYQEEEQYTPVPFLVRGQFCVPPDQTYDSIALLVGDTKLPRCQPITVPQGSGEAIDRSI
jgi:hypothetical protein